jgi:S1-C subfamily serine protease
MSSTAVSSSLAQNTPTKNTPATTTSAQVVVPAPALKPVSVPVLVPIPTSTTAATTTTSGIALPPVIAIDPQTLVGIVCYYNPTYTTDQPGVSVSGVTQEEVRGSGVIINSRGDILTNRHIVAQAPSTTSIPDDSGAQVLFTVDHNLDHCEVGRLPADATLPTPAQIQSLNPFVQVPVLGYTAQPVYISPLGAPLSSAEGDSADFAVLRITGVTKQGPTFGVTSVPSVFPYVKLLPVKPYDMTGETVVTYGFPGDVTTGQGNAFETLTMTGSVGRVTVVYGGDSYYLGTPLTIDTDLEVSSGRSGSPLFWRGYVIGLVTFFFGDNRTDSGSVASDVMLPVLRQNGYIANN